jgi:23S rRNA (adenine1618-N6)-methyltransferase
MAIPAKEEKKLLHPRNKHRSRYDFALLVKGSPALREFIIVTPYGEESIDFANPAAVKMLNKALLKQYYDIAHWDIPENYLCPPIPGRADYIHYLADLLAEGNEGKIPTGKGVKILDVGVGANCVYPLIGHQEYGWTFVGSEVDKRAVEAVKNIIAANANLSNALSVRLQPFPEKVLEGIIKPGEKFDLTICNPPFHSSAEAAAAGAQRKMHNLGKHSKVLNFGGQPVELWCKGGEITFIQTMIQESVAFGDQVQWFSTLVSKSANVPDVYYMTDKVGAARVRTVEMAQGQKTSRFVAWSFQP